MGGDYFADGDGNFAVAIYDSKGSLVRSVRIDGLDPGEELHFNVAAGRPR